MQARKLLAELVDYVLLVFYPPIQKGYWLSSSKYTFLWAGKYGGRGSAAYVIPLQEGAS